MTAPAPEKIRRTGAGTVRHNPLSEIWIAPRARDTEPEIIERDDLAVERSTPGAVFTGRVYLVWTEHDPDGGCDRDPADGHEDLGYVGKTTRPFYVRQREHLAPSVGGKPNRSAVYRNRAKVTGWSMDPRVYADPDGLAAAELRAIKTFWPAWNIADADRRNPATRATRARRKPDRLAPLIGIASALWLLLWAAISGGLLWIAWTARADWYWVLACPAFAYLMVTTASNRHRRIMARRSRRR